jgi:hypothetical protein
MGVSGGLLTVGAMACVASSMAIAAPPAAVKANAAAADDSGPVAEQLKGAVRGAKASLGALEPWQSELFDQEVMPLYQRFIKDYRQSETGVNAVVDTDSLRRYLIFYGPKVSPDKKNVKVGFFVRADSACAPCMAELSQVTQMVRARLERRGLNLVTIPQEDVSPKIFGDRLEDRVAELASQKGLAGAVVAQWQVAPADDMDSAHADEVHYLVRTLISIPGFTKQSGLLNLLANDNIEAAVSRLITDAMTELGGKVEVAQNADNETEEMLIEVDGIRDYAHLTRARNQVLAKLKDAGQVEDRKFSRGKVVFAVRSHSSPDAIRKQLAALRSDSTWDKTLQVEVK